MISKVTIIGSGVVIREVIAIDENIIIGAGQIVLIDAQDGSLVINNNVK